MCGMSLQPRRAITGYGLQRRAAVIYIWTPEANEGSCETGELRNPAAVEHLLELSKNSQVMVASCDGFIRRAPFRTASSMEPSPMSVQRPFATEKLSLIVGTPTREK